jgi:hypothetical protein
MLELVGKCRVIDCHYSQLKQACVVFLLAPNSLIAYFVREGFASLCWFPAGRRGTGGGGSGSEDLQDSKYG